MNKYFIFSIVIVLTLLLKRNYTNAAELSSDENTIFLMADGSGSTKEEALSEAWYNAVKKEACLFFLDDNTIQQIIAQSRAKNESYKEISATEDALGWKVVIVASMERDILQKIQANVVASDPAGQLTQKISDDKYVVVQAEGLGITKIEALNAAWAEAVRQGVGLFLTSKTEVLNDDITEQIITHSRGRVNSYKEVSAEKTSSGWKVQIEASIEKDILKESTNVAAKSQTVSFDGSNIAAKQVTEKNQKNSAQSLSNHFNFSLDPKDYLLYHLSIKNKNGEIFALHTIGIDIKKFQENIIPEVTSILDQIGNKKIEDFYTAESIKINKNYSAAIHNFYKLDNYELFTSYSSPNSNPYISSDIHKESINVFIDSSRYIWYNFIKDKDIFRSIKQKISSHSYKLQFYISYVHNEEESIYPMDPISIRLFTYEKNNAFAPVIAYQISESEISAAPIVTFRQQLNLSSEELTMVKNFTGNFRIL